MLSTDCFALCADPLIGAKPFRFAMRFSPYLVQRLVKRCFDVLVAASALVVLSPFLSQEPEPGDYEKAGAALDLAARTVAVTVHRLRQRYRAVLREELAAGSHDSAQLLLAAPHVSQALALEK